ncbi:MAG: YidC/Oxa1 family membrane protein insertase [Suipraeoptans sp.]
MITTLLTAANWPIVGQIAWLMGKLMNLIYTFLDTTLPTETGLVGLSMVLYTIIVYMLMLPMTINQQKTSKMTAAMQPEVQAVQKKYANKKDQASMMKQQEEIQQVYDKYGTSMFSSCLPLLIQMPFLFALYPVIYNITEYVPAIANAPASVQQFLTIPDITVSPIDMIRNSGDFSMAPALVIITGIALPVISGLTQFVSTKLMQGTNQQPVSNDKENPMAGTMKTMNYMMPLMSVFIVVSAPAAIGLYWITSACVRLIQQLAVNKYLKKFSIDDIIEKNREKAEKKMRKRGEQAEKVNTMAHTNTRSLSDKAKVNTNTNSSKKDNNNVSKDSTKSDSVDTTTNNDIKPGSLADKANLVKRFNENK